jgi:hypothetical protein
MSLAVLSTELATDPLSRGYSGMSDAEVVTDLYTAYVDQNRSSMTGSEVLNAVDKTEFNAKTADQKRMVWDVVHMGVVNPFGIEEDLFTDIFGVGSNTIAALVVARKTQITRIADLGLGKIVASDVAKARA